MNSPFFKLTAFSSPYWHRADMKLSSALRTSKWEEASSRTERPSSSVSLRIALLSPSLGIALISLTVDWVMRSVCWVIYSFSD